MIFRPNTHAPGNPRRRGVILIVVLALLTLFAILGLAFATYSGAEATSGRIWKEAAIRDNERDKLRDAAALAWNMFLGQSIYGVREDDAGYNFSALWGHDLARNMYGWNPGPLPPTVPGAVTGLNDKPYVGTGRLRETLPPVGPVTFPPDTEYLVNHTYYQGDGFIRYPGRLGVYQPPAGQPLFPPTRDGTNPLTGDLHVSYTFPDHNNVYLAQVGIVTTPGPDFGKPIVNMPSFYRPWMAGANFNLADPTHPSWVSPDGKYRLMRPRPFNQTAGGGEHPGFPYPTDPGGDVKNFDFGAGGNDSIWIDIGAPVLTGPDGTRFKPLVAPLIIDLDGRINLNTAGNLLLNRDTPRAGPPAVPDLRDHASNQGWGPWEVNPKRVLDWASPSTPPAVVEWRNLFVGDPALGLLGRYGLTQRPQGAPGIQGGGALRRYFPMDYNAITETNGEIEYAPGQGTPANVSAYALTPQWRFPGEGAIPNQTNAVPPYQAFPLFSNWGYNNARPTAPRTLGETNFPPVPPGQTPPYNHPDQYNVFRPQGGNRTFGTTDLVSLLRRINVGGDQVASDLMQLVPNNLEGQGVDAIRRRQRVTTHSFDVDRPGSPPYAYTADFVYPAVGGAGQPRFSRPQAPLGQPFPAPTLAQRQAAPSGTEFSPVNWAADLSRQEYRSPGGYVFRAGLRVDLGRRLTAYPPLDPATALYRNTAADQALLLRATIDRQNLAWEVYTTLWQLAGAENYTTMVTKAANDPSVRAHRWLAQLAVNLVDFIDYDDNMTAFEWRRTGHPADWVFGTEKPRLVINEYYAQWDNEEAGNDNTTRRVNVWAELHNPFPPENAFNDPAGGAAILRRPGAAGEPVYRLVLTRAPNPGIRDPENVLGNPDLQYTINGANVDNIVGYDPINDPLGGVVDWGGAANARTVDPNYGAAGPNYAEGGTPGRNRGFYLVGSNWTYPNAGADPGLSAGATHTTDRLTYDRPKAEDPIDPTQNNPVTDVRPALLLRRLANPYRPFQNDPAQPLTYNPYVTVDYAEQLRVTNGLINVNGTPRSLTDNTVFNDTNPRAAWGRNQPFAAWLNPNENLANTPANEQNWRRQNPFPALPNVYDLRHTFFRHNAREATAPPAGGPTQTLWMPPHPTVANVFGGFEVLVHPDRQPTNVAELLHVSGFRPHELTQQFVTYQVPTGGNPPPTVRVPHGHIAPFDGTTGRLMWADPTVRVHRLLEYLTVGSRAAGVSTHGRVPGKININTVWDKAVLDAIADAYAPNQARPNRFHQADIDQIWALIVDSRRGGPAGTTPEVSQLSRPFWGLGTGLGPVPPAGDALTPAPVVRRGVQNTMLRPSTMRTPQDQMIFEQQFPTAGPVTPPLTGPLTQALQRTELLSKIMGHLTTRSNVFGMWTTIGFFRVVDETQKPVRLGGEINWPQSGQVRIRTFALIDRTQLQVWPTYNDNGRNTVSYAGPNITLPPPPVPGQPQPPVVAPVLLWDANNQGITQVTNPNTGYVWSLFDPPVGAAPPQPRSGVVLTFEPDTDNEETVVVRWVAANNRHEATFTKPHPQGCVVVSRGHPGPWISYDPLKDIGVIMHQELFD